MKLDRSTSLSQAEDFLKSCIRYGLAHSLESHKSIRWVKPYPEVTGYLVSYFCRYQMSHESVVGQAIDKLLSIQHPSGGYSSFYDKDKLYSFDTGQIITGLTDAYRATGRKDCLISARHAGDFLLSMQIDSGLMFPIYDTKRDTKIVYQKSSDGSNWGSTFSYIQVKNAEGLISLYELTKERKYYNTASRLVNLKMNKADYHYTHPLAYYLEGLVALGQIDRVKKIIQKHVLPRLKPNGYIAYYPKATFAYVSGSVQMGILLWKVGYKNQAKQILGWAARVQGNSSAGGLYQYATSSGKPDASIHTEINSWGTKYYCELLRLVVN